ncbi:hypothetical protein NC796_12420 [Aliifodinibius sp. S!AR15-10]|uniref:hypothetical protein n=1 Tax=Aliifodinibius sp. S!AR15-10 TaxID=2950437 RepID=UPI00285B8226|nr:hypothetical protein [Aliifodinibius sp. S!AR15-10]MDR8391954.1 hypothetical protein [Aliifodinibius sp. S!AR15-10]
MPFNIYTLTRLLFIALVFVIPDGTDQPENAAEENQEVITDNNVIQPYSENSWYWQYEGEPVVLIGASDDDNLYQWTGKKLTDHLDLLTSLGGNYVRNTMSDRDEGNVYAFDEVKDGVYDLDQWNQEYWDRLEFFLEETSKRDIIVQLTLWDHFDLSGSWDQHPWNPQNNVNLEEGIIEGEEDVYGGSLSQNIEPVLNYQQKYIKKLMSVTLQYGNVLYNINNEGSQSSEWDNYWAKFIKQQANEAGRDIHVTSMIFDPSSSVRHAMTFSDIYSYVDISQNNQDSRGGRGPAHYNNIMDWRKKLGANPMPMNNVKVYGSQDGPNYSAGSGREAVERFWRNIFAGTASSRFHRPAGTWGTGLNERAQTSLKAMSMLLEELDIFNASPHNDLLSSFVELQPSAMEAYCLADIGEQYAVYFPGGRYTIDLDPWVFAEKMKIKWLHINEGTWSEEEIVDVQWEGGINQWGHRGTVRLETPGNEPYVALIEPVEE